MPREPPATPLDAEEGSWASTMLLPFSTTRWRILHRIVDDRDERSYRS